MAVEDLTGTLARASVLVRLLEDGGRFYGHPYRDLAGVWTIGTGLTRWNGQPVGPQTPPITVSQDITALQVELRACCGTLDRLVARSLSADQAAALVSLVFNCGSAPLVAGSHIALALQRNDMATAANGFLLWTHVRGVVVGDLVLRRRLERAVFLGVVDALSVDAITAEQERLRLVPSSSNATAPSAGALAADMLMNLYNPGV